MKKIIAVICSAILILTVFSACGKKEKSSEANNGKNAEEIYAEKTEQYKDNGHPVGVIVMENGDTMVFELYEDVAPNTVKNFISLANSGFYNGTIFHRVIPGFMIQGGDPNGTGMGGPGYNIFGEFSNNGFKNSLKHERGVLSMAREGNRYDPASAYNTAGSQFFIMVKNNRGLDGDYATFGRVLEGMEVADAIVSVKRDANDKPYEEQKMQLVKVNTFGVEYGEPETLPER